MNLIGLLLTNFLLNCYRILNIWLPELQTTTTQAPTTTSTQRSYFDEGTVDFNDFITEKPNSSEEIEEYNAINLHSNEI